MRCGLVHLYQIRSIILVLVRTFLVLFAKCSSGVLIFIIVIHFTILLWSNQLCCQLCCSVSLQILYQLGQLFLLVVYFAIYAIRNISVMVNWFCYLYTTALLSVKLFYTQNCFSCLLNQLGFLFKWDIVQLNFSFVCYYVFLQSIVVIVVISCLLQSIVCQVVQVNCFTVFQVLVSFIGQFDLYTVQSSVGISTQYRSWFSYCLIVYYNYALVQSNILCIMRNRFSCSRFGLVVFTKLLLLAQSIVLVVYSIVVQAKSDAFFVIVCQCIIQFSNFQLFYQIICCSFQLQLFCGQIVLVIYGKPFLVIVCYVIYCR